MATATGLVRREYNHFDQHAFAGRRIRAVSKESGIAFADFNRMHIVRRAKLSGRWTVPPTWSQNDEQLRECILRFLEGRFFIRNHGGTKERLARIHGGTNEERLARIEERSVAQIPGMERNLKGLLARYNEEARFGAPQAHLDMTAIQIQNLDAQICMQRRGIAGVLTSFAYMHFRLIYNSVQIAGELGLKPPMVRIWAHRMQLLGREIFEGIARPPYRKRTLFVVPRPSLPKLPNIPKAHGEHYSVKYDTAVFLAMWNQGYPVIEIGRVTGASTQFIYKSLKQLGYRGARK